jgi:hypothetical protein
LNPELEEIVKRRDYKLKYIFGCPRPDCGKSATIFVDRDEYDLAHNRSNIKQKCYDGHITRPFKRCTKCNNNYEIEVSTCSNCEPNVISRATNEVLIEACEKELKKFGKQLRQKKITDQRWAQEEQRLNGLIEIAKKELSR